jgi:hypothetical protein
MGDGTETGPMIEAEGLAKHYGKTRARALAGVGLLGRRRATANRLTI